MAHKKRGDALQGSFVDKLLEAAVEIRQDPDAAERAYTARKLVQCLDRSGDSIRSASNAGIDTNRSARVELLPTIARSRYEA